VKILIYTNAFSPQVGGQETIVMLLAQGLALHETGTFDNRPEVTVVTSTSGGTMDDGAFPFRVVRRPGFLALLRLFRNTDIIHLAGAMMIPMILGLLLRKHVIVEHHGFQPICPNGQLLFKGGWCPGHFMAGKHRECIQCNSEQGKLRSASLWLLTFPRRWLCQRVAANVLPTEWLGSLLRLRRMKTILHGLASGSHVQISKEGPPVPTFAFVGRLVSTKGVRILLEAAQQLKAKGLLFKVMIIGQGPDRQSLEDLARDLEIQSYVRFLGYVPDGKVTPMLRNISAIIMPSVAGEVFGLSAAENMLNGSLVIASDLGSLSEVVGDSGMTFPAGDSKALAALMSKIIADPNLVCEYGQRAQQRIVNDFSWDTMVREHVMLYRRVLSS
jgi:glycogen(starch) synthase